MGEIQLEWKNHDKDLSTKLLEFFKEEYLVDFNVTCHGQQMKVHKFVLALLFPMLKESLRSSGTFPFEQELTEDGSPEEASRIPKAQCLNLDNIAGHAEDVNYLIQYAYTGKTTVPEEHIDCLVHIADSMGIKSLKSCLNRCHAKRKPVKVEQNTTTPLTRLRPRTQMKKNSNDSVITVGSGDNDDFDVHSIVDEESSLDSVESFEDCSDDDDERNGKSTKRIITTQKNITQKRQSEVGDSKEKTTNSTETSENLTKRDSKVESDDEAPVSPPKDEIQKEKLKCSQCNYTAPYPANLKRHLESHSRKDLRCKKNNTSRNLKCTRCDYIAQYSINLKRHLESHKRKDARGPMQFHCKTCKKGFESRKLLDTHRDSKCGTESLDCKYCGQTAFRKYLLVQHMISKHQVDEDGNPLEKNIKCPDCDFVCYAKHQLSVHERAKHERMGKYKCTECNYTGPYITQIRRHERIVHQNQRDFMCEECGYRFMMISHLKRHVMTAHKGEKPYKCHICNAAYSDSLSFKLHVQRHEGKVEYKFVCHICGHNLRKKYDLKIHMRKKHNMELEERLETTDDPNPCQSEDAVQQTS